MRAYEYTTIELAQDMSGQTDLVAINRGRQHPLNLISQDIIDKETFFFNVARNERRKMSTSDALFIARKQDQTRPTSAMGNPAAFATLDARNLQQDAGFW